MPLLLWLVVLLLVVLVVLLLVVLVVLLLLDLSSPPSPSHSNRVSCSSVCSPPYNKAVESNLGKHHHRKCLVYLPPTVLESIFAIMKVFWIESLPHNVQISSSSSFPFHNYYDQRMSMHSVVTLVFNYETFIAVQR